VVKFDVEAGEGGTENTIFIRGISADVDRAIKEILQIVENAKNDEIINSYVSANMEYTSHSHRSFYF
jgi:hypothetical protein